MKAARFPFKVVALAATAAVSCPAQEVVSEPLGFNKIPCLPNSDTIVGVPFRPNGSQTGALASNAVDNGNDTATLTIAGSPNFSDDAFNNTHYVKFSSGAKDGRFYPIVDGDANTLTIELSDDSSIADPSEGAMQGDTLVIAKFWTLGELFPPDLATTDPTTTGHAVVASDGTLPENRRTEILLPDQEKRGINLPPNRSFFLAAIDPATKLWLQTTSGGFVEADSQQLWPDTYLMIRQPGAVTVATNFRCSGEVETGAMAIPLNISAGRTQDNFIAIPRPIDVALNDLGLISSGAFTSSPSSLPEERMDELFLYDNLKAMRNRIPSAVYFHTNGNWLRITSLGFIVANDEVVAAGAGIVIRKAKGTADAITYWPNHPSY